MEINHLKINGIVRPLGFDLDRPILSWQVEGAAGKGPVSARVRVAEEPDMTHVLWEKEGDLPWEGLVLDVAPGPRRRCWVEVQVTDETGEQGTGRTWFETGKGAEPWAGYWIGPPEGTEGSPVLSLDFPAGAVRQGRLYITGLGLYRARLNGQRVGDEVLTPGLSDYEREVQYQTYDVTRQLRENNRLEVLLGKGWYMGRYGLEKARPFGSRYALLAEVRLTMEDGSRQVYATDDGWRWHRGPVRDDGIYDGETLDRLTPPGEPEQVERVAVELAPAARYSLPIREMEALPVREVIRTPAGETVLDFGQNHTGWVRFRARLPRGCRVCLEFGEVLQQGNFYNGNYRGAVGGFRYISDGREETVEPAFTFFGFRYVRLTGWPGAVNPADFDSPVVYSDMETTGELSVGHPQVDRLLKNALWSQKSNFLDIPTDCPQRDERLGWTGDAQVFAPTACCFMDCRAFYRKFLRMLGCEQRRNGGAVPVYVPSMGDFNTCAIWGDAAVLIPHTILQATGSVAEVEAYYPMMRDWVEWIHSRHPGHLYDTGFQFGDWLAQDGVTPQSFKGGTDDVFLASAYYCQSAALTAQMAGLLGREADCLRYEALAGAIREKLMEVYVTPAGRLSVDTQAAYVTALRLRLYRDREVMLGQLRRRLRLDGYRIRCGFAGAPLLCHTLAGEGLHRLACDFLVNREFPGWLYCVELGATTIWERWNSLLPDGTVSGTGMNSLNHYAYGSVAGYVFQWVAGLRPESLGYRRAVIAPRPDIRLGWLDCACRTASGLYRVCWRIEESGELDVRLEVPFGCTAAVTLPDSGREPFEVGAGRYEYRYLPTRDYLARYDWESRLGQLEDDPAAMETLRETLPQLYGMVLEKNEEFTVQTLAELSQAFYMGLDREKLANLLERLKACR